ncbi:hypothetical protein G3578_01535 [Brevibacillus sp. SYP-B805]|nr:hypothetical protein [Brevibacillus sp. SYP-B805]NGQ93852.1 hypothetical protein [Brevibacillus sp. SYP-B805]
MHVFTWIGETLLFAISLPLIAFQTFEGIQGLADVFALLSQYIDTK